MKQNHNVCPLSSCADKNHNTIGLRCQFHFPKKQQKRKFESDCLRHCIYRLKKV